MTSPLSRRSALTGAFPALAVLTLGATRTEAAAPAIGFSLLNASPVSAGDSELLSREPELLALIDKEKAARVAHSIAEDAYFEEMPDRPSFDTERYIGLPAQSQREYMKDWSAQLRIYEAEERRIKGKHKVDDLEETANLLGDELFNLFAEIAEYQATTIAGLKFKARHADRDQEVRDSLIRDVLAMGEGGS